LSLPAAPGSGRLAAGRWGMDRNPFVLVAFPKALFQSYIIYGVAMKRKLMDIFIQSLATGHFLAKDFRWSGEPRESIIFHSTLEALDFCTSNRLADVRLVLKFDSDDRYDLNLPVPRPPEPRPDSV
jgi:hypothetical protein